MKHAHDLQRRLHMLETLSEAVSAMKSLAAHHFRKSRDSLAAAHAYREAVEQVIAAIDLGRPETQRSTSGVLLVASDLGLCGGYNTRLTRAAIDRCREVDASRIYCIGQRPATGLKQAELPISRQYRAPSSVAGLTELLLQLAQDLLEDYVIGIFNRLDFVSARFDGVGEFTPITTEILPVESLQPKAAFRASPYVGESHLVAVAVREYLYIRLFQTLLESLTAEHGSRLVATQSAGEWLSSKMETVRRQLASLRREATTQEVLEIASSVRHANKEHSS